METIVELDSFFLHFNYFSHIMSGKILNFISGIELLIYCVDFSKINNMQMLEDDIKSFTTIAMIENFKDANIYVLIHNLNDECYRNFPEFEGNNSNDFVDYLHDKYIYNELTDESKVRYFVNDNFSSGEQIILYQYMNDLLLTSSGFEI